MAEFNPFTLLGKRILVTGATSGLGYASAVSMARMGAEIIGVGRNQERLAKLELDLAAFSDVPHCVLRADLTDAQQRDLVTASVIAPVHGVLHCAGISRLSPARMMTSEHLKEVQSINFDAPVLLTQNLLKRGLIANGGSLVFVSSIASHIGVAGVGVYSASKAGLIAYARCLAMEVVKRKIRVNCLSPSLVETPLFDAALETAGSDSMEIQRKNHPLGFGKPEDVANAAIFLLSDASRWITGTTMVMDGGLTIS